MVSQKSVKCTHSAAKLRVAGFEVSAERGHAGLEGLSGSLIHALGVACRDDLEDVPVACRSVSRIAQ